MGCVLRTHGISNSLCTNFMRNLSKKQQWVEYNKKIEWLELHGYSPSDVFEDEFGQFVYDIDDSPSDRVYRNGKIYIDDAKLYE